MAPVEKKRKTAPTNESFARSRNPPSKENESRPAKRPRQEEGQRTGVARTKISQVREEEAAFPRGGASLLTPLEHKQIQIEATQDVLFEQQGKSRRADPDDDDVDMDGPTAKKSKSKGKGKKTGKEPEPEEPGVKIESLSYKVFLL